MKYNNSRFGLVLGAWLLVIYTTQAFALTGEEIMRQVDANMTFGTARMESRMVIHVDKEVRTKSMVMYQKGKDSGYAEFISPARDKGVKYLKIKDNMWMYLPSVDKTVKIAGHMLRQSMMGSDFSYEDALESEELLTKYNAALSGEEIIQVTFNKEGKTVSQGRPCYVVDLVAKVKDITYYKRKVWVDKELFVPVKEELFALSGTKLKVTTIGNVQQFGERHYPLYYTMRNQLRKNSLTEMVIDKIEFDISIPEKVFTQGNLTK